MKNILKKWGILALVLVSVVACEDWTEPEALDFSPVKSEAYYLNLRAYKKSDHQLAFGWFGNWTGKGASLVNSLMGLPDSVDFVSAWGTVGNLTPEQKADLKAVQEIKGTRVLICFITQNIGDQLTPKDTTAEKFWGFEDVDEDKETPEQKEARFEAIRRYARAIVDTIDKYGYNGFDIDYEPNWGHSGNLAGHDDRMTVFIEELAKYLGPKSGTDRWLVLDGEPQSCPPAVGNCINYFIVQAYACTGASDLQGRINRTYRNFEGYSDEYFNSRKYIVTENFESYEDGGGYEYFRDINGNIMPSLEGMARWQPTQGRKGGVGTYHMEYEYKENPEYKYLRQAIQIMNPAVQ